MLLMSGFLLRCTCKRRVRKAKLARPAWFFFLFLKGRPVYIGGGVPHRPSPVDWNDVPSFLPFLAEPSPATLLLGIALLTLLHEDVAIAAGAGLITTGTVGLGVAVIATDRKSVV